MGSEARLTAMGVDGCRGGWIAACAWSDGSTALLLAPTIGELVDARGDDAVVAIDIPIGLRDDGGQRACDVAAREALGARRSTVFHAPQRWMLAYDSYADLRAEVERRRRTAPTLASLSAQAFGIVPKIREVDDWLATRPSADTWLMECHPELSFMALNGGRPLDAAKKTAEGQAQRRALAIAAFPDAGAQLDAAASRWPRARVAADDPLDAYANLHSALAVARDEHVTLGDGARDQAGRPMRIVHAPFSGVG